MYHIEDRTHANWPGRLPYRGKDSKRGYPTEDAAYARLARVVAHYNANHGCSPGDLRVVAR